MTTFDDCGCPKGAAEALAEGLMTATELNCQLNGWCPKTAVAALICAAVNIAIQAFGMADGLKVVRAALDKMEANAALMSKAKRPTHAAPETAQ